MDCIGKSGGPRGAVGVMSEFPVSATAPGARRPWDARLARRLVAPLKDTRVTPNQLTTVRLVVGLAGIGAFLPGTYLWSNVAALLVILSNFFDHADGELARMSGKCSRIGHCYDLTSDAVITVLQFVAMGLGVGGTDDLLGAPPAVLGAIAGIAVAVIFFFRMRVEEMAGKAASQQGFLGGFETEDVLYLLPLVTLFNGVMPYLIAASIGAPLFAGWVIVDYRRVVRRLKLVEADRPSGAEIV